MSFEDRVKKHDSYARYVFRKLEKEGKPVTILAIEHTHPSFIDKIKEYNLDDATSRVIANMPDGAYINLPKLETVLLDVKRGDSIEKKAYEEYITYYKRGCNLELRIKNKMEEEYQVPIQEIKFLDSDKYIEKTFSPENRMPIVDGWICPRKWSLDKYNKWRDRNKRASGTPFKYIDFDGIREFRLNKEPESVNKLNQLI